MASMYETIMDLPLFKGVGRNQISQFLEKTQLHFINFQREDILISQGEACDSVRFLISGRVKVSRTNLENTLTLSETSAKGRLFGAERLYGIDTRLPFTVKALESCSIMEFSKQQFQTLLYSDSIYMLNFFNYLSLRSQRPVDSLAAYTSGDLATRLALWVAVATEPESTEITVTGDLPALEKATNLSAEALNDQLETLRRRRIVTYGRKSIRVLSRRRLIDFALPAAK